MYKLFFISISLVFLSFQTPLEKTYHKEYYADGKLKAQGWKLGDIKVNFWHFYHPNGKVASEGHYRSNKKSGYWHFYNPQRELVKEGHFINGKAEKWWIIYDIATGITKKYQYKNNKKEGYCLLYKKDRLFKAERYENDHKTGEWTDVFSFKRDNPNASL